MRSLSGVGIGLSLVFGSLLLALVAELYYLLWWKKKKISHREITEDDYNSPAAREFLHMFFCWKNPPYLSTAAQNPQQLLSSSPSSLRRITHSSHVHDPQALLHHPHSSKDGGYDQTQLMGLQDRFLFSIKEETKEDLDQSEDGKGSRSLSDQLLLTALETPFLTPIASPPYFTPPLTPMDSSLHYHHGFRSPSGDIAEFSRIWSSSPPPKLKFLKDAEDKLYRRKLAEEAHHVQKGVHKIDGSVHGWTKAPSTSEFLKDEENGSFITLNITCC